MAVKRLLFICTGNAGRSPMALFLLRRMVKSHPSPSIRRLVLDSAGTSVNGEIDKELVPALEKRGIWGVKHVPKQVTAELVKSMDLVLTMTEQQKRYVQQLSPSVADRVYLLRQYVDLEGDIEDIAGQGDQAYENLSMELETLLKRLVEKLATAPPVQARD